METSRTDLDYLGPRVYGGRRINEYLSIEAEVGRAIFQGLLWSGRLSTELRMWNTAATIMFHVPWEGSPVEPFAYAGIGKSFWQYDVVSQSSGGPNRFFRFGIRPVLAPGRRSTGTDHGAHYRTDWLPVLEERHAAATRPVGGPSGRLLLHAARHRGGGTVEVLSGRGPGAGTLGHSPIFKRAAQGNLLTRAGRPMARQVRPTSRKPVRNTGVVFHFIPCSEFLVVPAPRRYPDINQELLDAVHGTTRGAQP